MRRGHRASAISCAQMERLEGRLQCAAGALNTAFQGTGILKKLFRDTNDFIDVVVQKDGKIVAVGQTQANKKTKDGLVARFNANGTPDTTFNGTGSAIVAFTSTSDDIITSVAIDPVTQKIVVAGVTGVGKATNMFVARLTRLGKPDNGFGTSGKTTIDFNSQSDAAAGVVVESDSKIVVSGFTALTSNSPGSWVAMARLQANGTPDGSFGTGGKFISTVGAPSFGFEFGGRMVRQSDGKYVVALTQGSISTAGFSSQMGALRVTNTGSPDGTFGFTGRSTTYVKNSQLQLGTSVAIDPVTKNIIVAGATAIGNVDFGVTVPALVSSLGLPTASQADFRINRLLGTNGNWDSTFSGDGDLTLDFKTSGKSRIDGASSVSVDSKGRIYVFGTSQLNSGDPDFAGARITSKGTLDKTFDGDGMAIYQIGGSDGGFGARLGSGNIWVVGHSKKNGGKNYAILSSVLT